MGTNAGQHTNLEEERSGEGLRTIGKICGGALVLLMLFVYGLKFVQLDGWQYYFFRGTVDLSNACTAAVVPGNAVDDGLSGVPHRSLAVPHFNGNRFSQMVPKGTDAATAHYKCTFPSSRLEKTGGVTYLHTGWIFGKDVQVAVNGVPRARFQGNDKPIIPLTQNDLERPSVKIDIRAFGSTKGRLGLSGAQKMVVAQGTSVNARIMGLETALTNVRPLYNLLPILILGFVCLLGWLQGFRSRLIVVTMFFSICSGINNGLFLVQDVFPWEADVSWALAELFVTGSGFALLVFAMELLGVGRRLVPWVMAATAVILGVESAVLLATGNSAVVYDLFHPAYAFTMALGSSGLAIVYAYFNEAREFSDGRKKINRYFIPLMLLFGFTPLLNQILNSLDIWVNLYNYVNVFMPLFLGAVLLKTLVLIEQNYRMEREQRAKMESELTLAAELQGVLLPPEKTGQSHGWQFEIDSRPHAILGGDWVKTHECNQGALFVLGDVVGKGASAALTHSGIAASWESHIRQWSRGSLTAEDLLTGISDTMYDLFQGSMNTTFAAAELTPEGRVRISSGGSYWLHLSPSGSRVITPTSRSLLGLRANLPVQFVEVDFKPGDWLISFTDGVMEGNRSIKRFLRKVRDDVENLDAEKIKEQLFATGAGEVHADDASVLILKAPDAKDNEGAA